MLIFLGLGLIPFAAALETKDGAARLPVLGWNSWNAYLCDINEAKILKAADNLQSLGLQAAGYNYINIDGCWSVKDHRDPVTHQILPNMANFPSGIAGLVSELHDRGFKVGIYSVAGSKTCAGYPGSLWHEDTDAATFAAWGIDYLKYDNCNVPSSWPGDQYNNCHPDYNHPTGPNNTCVNGSGVAPQGYNWSSSSTAQRFRRMHDALAKQNRSIVYSLCEWGEAGVTEWGPEMAQSWRVKNDIFPYWSKIVSIISYACHLLNSVDFFSHNDADILEVGNGNLTLPETRTHFALWAAMKSPLLIGTDLSKLSGTYIDILKNKDLLAFNQDPNVGAPAEPFLWDYTSLPEFWAGSYGDGRELVLMVNYGDGDATKEVQWGDVPGTNAGKCYLVEDIWTGDMVGCMNGGLKVDVASHDTAGFVVSGEC